MNPIDLLTSAERRLADAGIESPRLDAEVLLAHALGCARFELYTKREPPSEAIRRAFDDLVRRRAEGCPVAYLTGVKEFWSIPLRVTPAVLIPRPETELVVECALRILSRNMKTTPHLPSPLRGEEEEDSVPSPLRGEEEEDSVPSPLRGEGQGEGVFLLDLCTGSGCIAAALAKEIPGARLVVTDASADAIAVAHTNLAFAADRVTFLVGDLFDALLPHGASTNEPTNQRTNERLFDLITSNPPYIPTEEVARLPRDIARFEPREALDGGKCGLDFAARIIEDTPRFLKAGGRLVMEMGAGQAGALKEAGERAGFREIRIFRDLAGVERVVCFRKQEA